MKNIIKKILKEETTSDFLKIKELVLNMKEEDYSLEEIKSVLGINNDILILCLKDEKIKGLKEDGRPSERCEVIFDLLYNQLFDSSFIERRKSFDDGSSVKVYYDYYSGTLDIDYISSEGIRYLGLATFLWGGSCAFFLDITDYTDQSGGDFSFDHEYSKGTIDYKSHDPSFNNISTLNDIITYFNKNYFDLVKKAIDEEADIIYDYWIR